MWLQARRSGFASLFRNRELSGFNWIMFPLESNYPIFLTLLQHEDRPGVLAPAVYLWDHETGRSACMAASLSELIDED